MGPSINYVTQGWGRGGGGYTDLVTVFRVAYEATMTMGNISAGFRKCGIYPFNKDAINKEKLMPTDKVPDVIAGIHYLPSATLPVSATTPTAACIISEPATTSSATVTSVPSNQETTPVSTPTVDFEVSKNQYGMPPTTPLNLLVLTGLIPAHLADIFITPTPEPIKKNTRIIIKECVLTSDEWKNKIEAKHLDDEEKERKKSERKEKMDAKKAKKDLIKVRLPFSSKKTRKTTRNVTELIQRLKRPFTEEEVDPVNEAVDQEETVTAANAQLPVDEAVEENQTVTASNDSLLLRKSIRTGQKRKVYAIYDSSDSSEDSDDEDSEDICAVCEAKKPPNKLKIITWVYCDECNRWLHTYCEGINSVNSDETYTCSLCLYS